eukprot:647679-Rhodomonas_salina.1
MRPSAASKAWTAGWYTSPDRYCAPTRTERQYWRAVLRVGAVPGSESVYAPPERGYVLTHCYGSTRAGTDAALQYYARWYWRGGMVLPPSTDARVWWYQDAAGAAFQKSVQVSSYARAMRCPALTHRIAVLAVLT